MQVPRSAYAALTEAVNDLSGSSRRLFETRFYDGLGEFLDAGGMVPSENVAALRDYAIALLDEVGGATADISASYGAEFFDAARTEAVGSPLGHSPNVAIPHEANSEAVRGMIEKVRKTGDVSAFAAACAARVDYIARKSCGDAVAACCAKDPRKPRFARVPSGGETCRFCLMLASRGAVYHSKDTAGAVDHYHANCDCKAVPDFGDGIEGYDDKALYDKWQDLEHADAAERAERNGTTEAEEYEKRMKQLGEGAKRANERRRSSYYAHVGGFEFDSFDDVRDYLYASESIEDLEHRYMQLGRLYGFKSEQMRSQSVRNAVRHVEKRYERAEGNARRRELYRNNKVGGGIDVEIDEFTPCLRRTSDGKIVSTRFETVHPDKADFKEWQFDWSNRGEPRKFKALYADGDDRIQGMLEYSEVQSDESVFVHLVESAPFNSPNNPNFGGKKEYNGVGAHLFAEAVKISYENGYDGYVFFDSKTKLIDYYESELGAVRISTTRMCISGKASKDLYERYYGKRT